MHVPPGLVKLIHPLSYRINLECCTFTTTALNHIKQEAPVQIRLASIMVDNQENALRFYTTILGFVKNKDIPMGQFRWLTVSSPEGAEGVELVLEPIGFAPAQAYQQAFSSCSGEETPA